MDVRLLGPVEIVREDGRARLRRGRQQHLVALLALRPGERVGLGDLTEALWPGGPPKDPANTVQQLVAQVRRALGDERDRLQTVERGYRLRVSADQTDVGRVTAAHARARRLAGEGRIAEARRILAAALASWRGAELDGLTEGPLGTEAQRLVDLHADLHVLGADLALRAEDTDGLADALANACARHPLHEPLWARRIAVMARTGRSAEALATYEQLRHRLADELGVDPGPELRALHMRLLREEEPLAHSAGPVRTDVPAPLTRFFGRDRERARLAEWLAGGARLITVVGAGGVGKTRLIAEHLRARAPLVFVRLEQVRNDGDVCAAVAAALGLREVGTRPLADVVAEAMPGDATVVLDNAEHVATTAAQVATDLIARRADLTVVLTSQRPLGIAGEHLLRLDPLPMPDDLDLDSAAESPAVGLLLDRVALARPVSATPDAEALTAAVAIAGALDGVPLALELAAARAGVMSLPQLAASLGDRLGLLEQPVPGRPSRHRRLSDAVSWSLDLLAPDERDMLLQCGVFSGCFAAPAVAHLTGQDPAVVLPRLVALAERSLIQVDDRDTVPTGGSGAPSGPGNGDGDGDGRDGAGPRDGAHAAGHAALSDLIIRFRLLQPVRAQALREVEARGDLPALHDRLGSWVVWLAEAADDGIRSAEQLSWMRRLDDARGDIDLAIGTALDAGDVVTAARIVAALGRYWDWRGRLRDQQRWTSAVIAAADAATRGSADGAAHSSAERTADAPVPPGRLGAVLAWHAFVAIEQADTARAAEVADRAVSVSRATGDSDGEAAALACRAILLRGEGRVDDAQTATGEALAVARRAQLAWGEGWAVNSRGYARVASGDLDGAARDAEESVRRFRALGDERAAQWGRLLTAVIDQRRGDADAARRSAREVMRHAERVGDLRTASTAYDLLATLAGDDAEAARLHGIAAGFRARRGQVPPTYADVNPGDG